MTPTDKTIHPGLGVGFRGARLATPLLITLLFGCASEEFGFRRFEVGPVKPKALYETAAEVVGDFYANVYGGTKLFRDEETLSFETDYILKKAELRTDGEGKAVVSAKPRRQKLFFKVIPTEEGADYECFATFEVFDIEDPDGVESPDDVWRFIKQDRRLEDLIFDYILKALIEKGLLSDPAIE